MGAIVGHWRIEIIAFRRQRTMVLRQESSREQTAVMESATCVEQNARIEDSGLRQLRPILRAMTESDVDSGEHLEIQQTTVCSKVSRLAMAVGYLKSKLRVFRMQRIKKSKV